MAEQKSVNKKSSKLAVNQKTNGYRKGITTHTLKSSVTTLDVNFVELRGYFRIL